MRDPTREGVLRAAAKVAEILPPSPLLQAEIGGATVWVKAESLQPIGAFKIRGASFVNLAVLPKLCPGVLLADIPAIIGSIDIVMGEVDR